MSKENVRDFRGMCVVVVSLSINDGTTTVTFQGRIHINTTLTCDKDVESQNAINTADDVKRLSCVEAEGPTPSGYSFSWPVL